MKTGAPDHARLGEPTEGKRAALLPVTIVLTLFMLGGCQTSDILSNTGTAIPSAASGDPSNSDLNQGKAQFLSGNYGLAEKHFRKAVELRRDNSEALLGLAASYDRLGRFDLADPVYEQLLKVAGRQPRVLNNMGYSQYLRGDKEKARKFLQEARAALPGDKTVEGNLALLQTR